MAVHSKGKVMVPAEERELAMCRCMESQGNGRVTVHGGVMDLAE